MIPVSILLPIISVSLRKWHHCSGLWELNPVILAMFLGHTSFWESEENCFISLPHTRTHTFFFAYDSLVVIILLLTDPFLTQVWILPSLLSLQPWVSYKLFKDSVPYPLSEENNSYCMGLLLILTYVQVPSSVLGT